MFEQDQKFIDPHYVFVLRALNKDCYYKRIEADFTPLINVNKNQCHEITPVFNTDQKYYTPGFILPIQQDILLKEILYHKKRFHNKRQSYQQKNSQQKLQIPDPKIFYCHVCKNNISTDYLTHINSEKHVRQIKKSSANFFISQIVQIVKNRNQNEVSKVDYLAEKSGQTKSSQKEEKTKKIAKKKTQTRKNSRNQSTQKNEKKDQRRTTYKEQIVKSMHYSSKILRSTNTKNNRGSEFICI